MIKPYECTQCGSIDFEDLGNGRVRCNHCETTFEVLTKAPKVMINKGANVVFGKNANVEIHGDMRVEAGANVDVKGHVTVLSDGKPAQFELIKVEDVRGNNGLTNR
jgi:DNA-directed RNA polymerase subunit RPC12/RpoP